MMLYEAKAANKVRVNFVKHVFLFKKRIWQLSWNFRIAILTLTTSTNYK